MKYIPRIGSMLTLNLPGETTRGEVVRVINDNRVIVEIGQPMTKNHTWRRGDLVPAQRTKAVLGGIMGETWEAVEDRAKLEEPPAEAPRKSPPKAAKPAAKATKKPPQKAPRKSAAKVVKKAAKRVR